MKLIFSRVKYYIPHVKGTKWPKVFGQVDTQAHNWYLNIPKIKLWLWTCCSNSLRSSVFPPHVEPAADLLPFRFKSINEVQHLCWVIRSGSQSVLQFLLKVLDKAEVRVLHRQVKLHTKLEELFLYGAGLCTEALSCWNRKETENTKMLYAAELKTTAHI